MTAPATSPEPGSPHGAAGRAIAVMEVVAASSHPLTLSEIGRRTRLAKATVHRLLAVLEQRNMVTRCRHGYVLGPGPRRWHHPESEPATTHLRVRTTPHLIALQRATGLVTALAVLVNHEAHLVDWFYDDRRLSYLVAWLARTPAHRTAAGKALLSYRPRDAECHLPERGPGMARSALARELATIRRRGVAAVRDERCAVHAIATVITDRRGRAVAAATLAGSARSVHSRTNVEALRRAAAAASVDLRAGAGRLAAGHSAMAVE